METKGINPEVDSDNDSIEDGDLPSFNISLFESGDSGSAFRTQNSPSNQLQRSNYIERKGSVDIRCSCLDTVHGQLSSTSDIFATLIVLEFRFDPRKKARRFESVDISLEFKGMDSKDAGPEVLKAAPDGNLSLMLTKQHEELQRNASLQLGAASPIGGLTATGALGWVKTVSRDASDQTTIVGSIDLVGRNWGPKNSVSWTLLENKTMKTGVPRRMRTAVLLKRKDENPFQCIAKIDAVVDLITTLGRVFGGKGRDPRDDPVLFDPDLDSTDNLQKYDTEELGVFDLESVCDIIM